ncbi:hypothetical protein D9M72_409230 [compost metagenome]
MACGQVRPLRRTRAVGGQLQQRLLTAEPLGPIGELTFALARFEPVALPGRVVGVLQGGRGRHVGGVPVAMGLVQRAEVVDQQLHRPAVGHDVVHHQHQQVRGFAGAQQAHAQQRAVRQVEGRAHKARGLVAHLRGVGTQIGFTQVEHRLGRHGLLRHAVVAHAEARAQRRMPRHQRLQARAQRRMVERAVQRERGRDVLRGAFGVHLPEEPLARLRVRGGPRRTGHGGRVGHDRQAAEVNALRTQRGDEFLLPRRRQTRQPLGDGPTAFATAHSTPRLSNNASMRSRSLSACAACCACAGPCASSACAHAARSGSSK